MMLRKLDSVRFGQTSVMTSMLLMEEGTIESLE